MRLGGRARGTPDVGSLPWSQVILVMRTSQKPSPAVAATGQRGTSPPAGLGTWAAGMKHFAWARGETVVQFHGEGPWQIEYVDPRDDPRRPREK